ncbi:MAG: hypothetical protein M3Y69_02620 [Verrucomicrobiota bacterium]|nr:hypothetical protein [Verrucomicrobiota bacterium]
MKRRVAFAIAAACIATAFATDELPPPEESEPLEIDPPLLIQSRGPDGPVPIGQTNSPGDLDGARLEADLARAKKNAASGERLYKAGILAKVEAEDRALKVVRLEANLAEARLHDAKAKLDELKAGSSADEAFARELHAAETLVAETTQEAERAASVRRTAEVERAARNVERQRKLLALGSGRKADVNKAQEKLAELQQPAQ